MEFKQKEKYSGEFQGKPVSFNREWSGHRFTDKECADLLAGKVISFEATSKAGNKYTCYGNLAEQEYNGKTFFGFKPDFETKRIPDTFCGHKFTQKEKDNLNIGKVVFFKDLVSKKGNKFDAFLKFDKKEGLQMSFESGDE